MKRYTSSSYCSDAGCVEVRVEAGRVFVRDSSDLDERALEFTHSEWQDFINGVKNGEFDLP